MPRKARWYHIKQHQADADQSTSLPIPCSSIAEKAEELGYTKVNGKNEYIILDDTGGCTLSRL